MSKKCQTNVGYDLCLSDTSLPDVLARRQTNTKHIACLYATQAYSSQRLLVMNLVMKHTGTCTHARQYAHEHERARRGIHVRKLSGKSTHTQAHTHAQKHASDCAWLQSRTDARTRRQAAAQICNEFRTGVHIGKGMRTITRTQTHLGTHMNYYLSPSDREQARAR